MNESKKSLKRRIIESVGATIAGIALLLGTTIVVYPAVSKLAGIAVAQSSTLWNNVRDAAAGDNLSNGILMTALGMWDGTNFDRLRGSITNGILVDVTRITGSVTPADGFANPTTFLGTYSLTGVFNGTTWDRWRGQAAPVQIGTLLNSRTVSAANTATTITLTGVANTRIHVYKIQVRCSGGSSFITMTDGGTTVYDTDGGTITAGTQYTVFSWTPGYTAATGATVVITTAACGTGNISVTSVQADQF